MNRLTGWPGRACAGAFAVGLAGLIGGCLMSGPAPHSAALMHPAGGNVVAARPATTVKTVSCTPLPHVPGKSITMAVVTFPPGGYTPRHRHPGSVSAYVLDGSIQSQLAGGEPVVFAAGQGWFEPPGAVHLFAENTSDHDTARLLAIFVADDGCGPLIIPEHP